MKTEGLWQKCDSCGQIIWRKAVEDNLQVCPKCGHHFRMGARERLQQLFDDGEYVTHDALLRSSNPLDFVDSKPYEQRLREMENATHLPDAVVCASGLLNGRKVQICALELKFIGGSMGAVVGEKITRAIERCLAEANTADHRFGVRRRAHAGRRHQPDAAGQDLGRADASRRSALCRTSAC